LDSKEFKEWYAKSGRGDQPAEPEGTDKEDIIKEERI
jgi:hypothetical protein